MLFLYASSRLIKVLKHKRFLSFFCSYIYDLETKPKHSEQIDMIPVTLSHQAKSEIEGIFNQKKVPQGYGLRLTVSGGGCSGVSFKLGFDQSTPEDLLYADYGFEIMIAKKDLMHLMGKHIAFVETADARGFVFEDQ